MTKVFYDVYRLYTYIYVFKISQGLRNQQPESPGQPLFTFGLVNL